jgi:hypothetical protein
MEHEANSNNPTCCLCGIFCDTPYGSNPAPIAKRGRCCGTCNKLIVFMRMGVIPVELVKKYKKNKNLNELHDIADLILSQNQLFDS